MLAARFLLDEDTKAALTIQHRHLNTSTRIDAMAAYLKAEWTGTPTLAEVQEMVETAWCSDCIESFASNVPGANVAYMQGVLAVIGVMEG